MELQVNIEFDQLVKVVKKLPSAHWKKLKREVDKQSQVVENISDLEKFLLTAPTFSKKQLDEIAKTRNLINQWRTK